MPITVSVLLPLPLPAFSYLVPFDIPIPNLGSRVAVPWQNGLRLGIVMGLEEVKAAKALELKDIIATLDAHPFLSQSRLELIRQIAERTCVPEGQILATLLPYGLYEEVLHEVRAVSGVVTEISSDHWQSAENLKSSQLELYRRQGLIHERISLMMPTKRVLKPLRQIGTDLQGKPQAAQRQALDWLWEVGYVDSAAELARQADVSESAVRALIKKSYIGYQDMVVPLPALPAFSSKPLPQVSSSVPMALRCAVSGGSRAERLAAILPQIQRILAQGQNVLILSSEHANLIDAATYLQHYVPLLSLSGDMTSLQRRRLWEALQTAQGVVLLGTYLALLAPLEPLGAVVVLEAASSSYKLQAGARLMIPEAARQLAEILNIPLILTESLASAEMLHMVPSQHHLMLSPPKQRIHISDLEISTTYPLSPELIRVLKQVEERSRQAILLAPRRGFSSAYGCATCHHVLMCPNCDLSLRYHQQGVMLRCHQCGFVSKLPDFCPSCAATTLGPIRGAGTQWIVNEVKKHLQLSVYRFDADQRDDLSLLYEGEPGVVVATTAILRQMPLPKLSLIGITLLDTLLTLSDFRAEEETLRLLLQLSELSPGGRPLVLIQTFQPKHPLLQALLHQELERFSQSVLERRCRFSYPPFSDMAKIQVSAKQASIAAQEAQVLAERLQRQQTDVLGPSPAPVARLKGQYSYQLFVRVSPFKSFKEVLSPILHYQGKARLRIDIDPRDIGAFLE